MDKEGIILSNQQHSPISNFLPSLFCYPSHESSSSPPHPSSATLHMSPPLLLPIPYATSTPPKPHALPLPRASSTPTRFSSFDDPRATAIVVGAGLAGLSAAIHLRSAGVPPLLLESSDSFGGRVHTDAVDGFLLDRGFQIFLTAYPEARRMLDYDALDLRPFYPGALIYYNQRLHRVADPLRRPLDALSTLSNPIGSVSDKLLVGLARLKAWADSDETLLTASETSISRRLHGAGFSDAIIDRFFRPFLGGIFFDTKLSTTSRLLDFVFKCLALGNNSLPAAGIAAIPRQLAARLPQDSIRLNTRISSILPGIPPRVVLESGEVMIAHRGVILAVDQPEAERLLPQVFENKPGSQKAVRSTVCLYFSADRAAVQDPILLLNGSGQGIVNNMCFPSNVAPSYAPKGKALVSVSLIGDHKDRSDEDLADEVLRELTGWFGSKEVGSWIHLRSYRIGFAQPDQTPPTNLVGKEPRVTEVVYVCGDHRTSATFHGALVSGRMAAEALIKDASMATIR